MVVLPCCQRTVPSLSSPVCSPASSLQEGPAVPDPPGRLQPVGLAVPAPQERALQAVPFPTLQNVLLRLWEANVSSFN